MSLLIIAKVFTTLLFHSATKALNVSLQKYDINIGKHNYSGVSIVGVLVGMPWSAFFEKHSRAFLCF